MDTTEALQELEELQQKLFALNYALSAINLDAVTAAPPDTAEGRGLAQGVLSSYLYPLAYGTETGELLSYLTAHKAELSERDARIVEEMKRSYDETHQMPQEEYVAYQVLLGEAQSVWYKAKAANDYAAFAPYLEKIIDANRRIASYMDASRPAYEVLLDSYERGLTTQQLDAFFDQLRSVIVPLLHRIQTEGTPIDDSFLYQEYPIEQQRQLSDYLMEVLGIDRAHCSIAETEHPFTSNFDRNDVRITTHYYLHDVASSMYSVIHESGHALYELGVSETYDHTALAGGVSMGIHESQSRLFENMFGRSEGFINRIYPKLLELFPSQLSGVSAHDFYRAVNKVEPSLIRTEADELTYCLHIMVRYEIEKQMIAGTVTVQDLPALWAQKMQEYLGIDVPSDREGVLQDSHWSGGAIGYFPTYALGSAYAAQFVHRMQQDFPIYEAVAEGDFSKINAWLDEHIHQYGRFYPPAELFRRCCEAEFDPKYYTDYLTQKFSKIYQLD